MEPSCKKPSPVPAASARSSEPRWYDFFTLLWYAYWATPQQREEYSRKHGGITLGD